MIDIKYGKIVFILALLNFAFFGILRAKEYRLDVEFVIWDSLKTNHVKNNCNPHCAHENNGGWGFQAGIGGTLDISLVYIELTNSYGDWGRVIAIEPAKADFRFKMFRGEVSVWIMRVEGYKDEDGDLKTVEGLIPKAEFGVNLFYFWASAPSYTKNIFINYNYFNFYFVDVYYVSAGYYHTF